VYSWNPLLGIVNLVGGADARYAGLLKKEVVGIKQKLKDDCNKRREVVLR
jgi:hypothetical protein